MMDSKKIRVNVVSESEAVPGQGVDTAFHEMVAALTLAPDRITPLVNSREDADIVHIHTIGSKALRQLLSRRRHGRKVVTVHIVPASLIGSIKGARYYMPVMRAYMHFFYNHCDRIFAISKKVQRILVNELHISPDKIRLLYNGVDMDKYALSADERRLSRDGLGLSQDRFVVLGIGQTQPRKRLDSFIAAATELPDTQFIWLGGIPFKGLGADEARMKKLTKTAPDNVLMAGIVPHEAIRRYLAAADVFFLPSEQENHPMSVLEAAGAGLPIILRDIPEYQDTFKGLALLGHDDADFVKLIRQLRQPEAYAAAQAGATAIAKKFDNQAYITQLISYYGELLNN